jgi:NADP-dependent 3-hydroxy acid dehydrogenase YdfG
MSNTNDLINSKVVIITGASSGLGEAPKSSGRSPM